MQITFCVLPFITLSSSSLQHKLVFILKIMHHQFLLLVQYIGPFWIFSFNNFCLKWPAFENMSFINLVFSHISILHLYSINPASTFSPTVLLLYVALYEFPILFLFAFLSSLYPYLPILYLLFSHSPPHPLPIFHLLFFFNFSPLLAISSRSPPLTSSLYLLLILHFIFPNFTFSAGSRVLQWRNKSPQLQPPQFESLL